MDVFIAGIKKILPQSYSVHEMTNFIYSQENTTTHVKKIAHKFSKPIKIKNRHTVLNLEDLPNKKLRNPNDHPVYWGKEIIQHFSQLIPKNQIGFLSVAYNVSSHQEFLPNIACQIVAESNLKLNHMPENLPYYGCAAAILSIESAIRFCKRENKAAIVYCFDQCLWGLNPVYDKFDVNFNKTLRASLIFSDGAVGVLLVPETLRSMFDTPLPKIIDSNFIYTGGDEIKMEGNKFLLGNNIKNIMPPIVAENSVKPLIKRNNLCLSEIDEWSIHQGGITILEEFLKPNILGLSSEQLATSKEKFINHGNFSAPSLLVVLEEFINQKDNRENENFGCLVGFGAGYYYGSLLYKWASP